MKRRALLLLPLLLSACVSPSESGVKVIVGAKLIAAQGRAPVEYSVIVIDGARIRAAGPQSSTPVPKGAEMTRGLGLTVEPTGATPIEAGQPADLVLKGSKDRVMRNGEWVN